MSRLPGPGYTLGPDIIADILLCGIHIELCRDPVCFGRIPSPALEDGEAQGKADLKRYPASFSFHRHCHSEPRQPRHCGRRNAGVSQNGKSIK